MKQFRSTSIYIYIYKHIIYRRYRTHTYIPTTYIHTYIHTYVRTYVRTYIHTYIHTYVRTYVRTYIHTYIHTYIIHTHSSVPLFGCLYISRALQFVHSIVP